MKNILITGFEPFGGDTYNPSLEIVKRLSGNTYKDYTFQYAEIPVNRHNCIPAIQKAIIRYSPEIVICTGLAYGRAGISIERVAINVADFPWGDNAGYLALNETIDPDGKNAYFSTLPIRRIMKEIEKKQIPAYISNSAGTYCCNMLLYGTLNYIEKYRLPIRAGMIHVPYTPDMVVEKDFTTPSMSLDNMVQAIRIAAITSIDFQDDISIICGMAQ